MNVKAPWGSWRLCPYLFTIGWHTPCALPRSQARSQVRTTLRYQRSVRYLVRNGASVWEGHLRNVPRVDFYRITQRGPRFLEDA